MGITPASLGLFEPDLQPAEISAATGDLAHDLAAELLVDEGLLRQPLSLPRPWESPAVRTGSFSSSLLSSTLSLTAARHAQPALLPGAASFSPAALLTSLAAGTAPDEAASRILATFDRLQALHAPPQFGAPTQPSEVDRILCADFKSLTQLFGNDSAHAAAVLFAIADDVFDSLIGDLVAECQAVLPGRAATLFVAPTGTTQPSGRLELGVDRYAVSSQPGALTVTIGSPSSPQSPSTSTLSTPATSASSTSSLTSPVSSPTTHSADAEQKDAAREFSIPADDLPLKQQQSQSKRVDDAVDRLLASLVDDTLAEVANVVGSARLSALSR
jgi:hypothetical protein